MGEPGSCAGAWRAAVASADLRGPDGARTSRDDHVLRDSNYEASTGISVMLPTSELLTIVARPRDTGGAGDRDRLARWRSALRARSGGRRELLMPGSRRPIGGHAVRWSRAGRHRPRTRSGSRGRCGRAECAARARHGPSTLQPRGPRAPVLRDADERTRTSTPRRTQAPEAWASTNSATSACAPTLALRARLAPGPSERHANMRSHDASTGHCGARSRTVPRRPAAR